MTDWRALMRIPNGRGFSLDVKGFFQRNSVHGSRMRILCGFYAKGQEFVRIRLEKRFPNAFKNNKDLYAQIREDIARQMQKINFISLPKFHNP
jgi:hypothetical protein